MLLFLEILLFTWHNYSWLNLARMLIWLESSFEEKKHSELVICMVVWIDLKSFREPKKSKENFVTTIFFTK